MAMETRRLRSDVTFIVTAEVAREVPDYDKGIIKNVINETVQSPELLHLTIKIYFHQMP